MSGPDLWRESTRDRYIIWLPLRKGMSFEAAARRSHEVVLAAHQGIGDCVTAADTQLTLESNPAARWRLYGDSVESVSETLRRIESRDTTRHATLDTTRNTTLGPATETGGGRG